jgi:hypothetical protein
MKKLLFALPVILLLAAGCNFSKQIFNKTSVIQSVKNTASSTTSPITADKSLSGWKIYTSGHIALSFKYNPIWGNPKEFYYENDADKRVGISALGKILTISFGNDNCPCIDLASPDYSQYEGVAPYGGQVPINDYYNNTVANMNDAVYNLQKLGLITPAYSSTIGVLPALTYIEALPPGGMSSFWGIASIAKIDINGFGGITVSQDLTPPNTPDNLDQNSPVFNSFIKQAENKTLDPDTQTKIDQFNEFVSTMNFSN